MPTALNASIFSLKTAADFLPFQSHGESAALFCMAGNFILNLQIRSCKRYSSNGAGLEMHLGEVTNGVAVNSSI